MPPSPAPWMPRLASRFGTDMAGLQWVLDAYDPSYAAPLLPGGPMAGRFGRHRLFVRASRC